LWPLRQSLLVQRKLQRRLVWLRPGLHFVHGPMREQRVIHLRQPQLRQLWAFVLDWRELHRRDLHETTMSRAKEKAA
jgi:hypothetical protein